MNAYRWFRVGSASGTVSLSDFSKVADEVNDGQWLEISNSSFELIEGRFVQQSSIYLEQMSDAGEISPSALAVVRSIAIAAVSSNQFVIVRVEDSHRMFSSLVSFVARGLGFGFYIEPVDLRPLIAALMDGGAGGRIAIDSAKLIAIKVNGAEPATGVSSRVEISSKYGFEMSVVRDRLPPDFVLTSAKFEVSKVGVVGGIAVSSQGRCCLSGKLSGFMLEEIEAAFIC